MDYQHEVAIIIFATGVSSGSSKALLVRNLKRQIYFINFYSLSMENSLHRNNLINAMTKAGELEVLGGEPSEEASYFDVENFKFHGPGGFETDYAGLSNYFKSIRAAFVDRSIKRGIIVVEGNQMACQTWIEGKFVNEFTQSPAGTLKPNGQRVVFDLINIFRFDEQGRLVEEWVQTDYRSLLHQLGAEGK